MCTASWIFADDGLHLFFSRDELRSRLPARPPAATTVEGVRALAPTDADAGGTWLGANELGLVVGLLNAGQRPGAEVDLRRATSRGCLVRSLLAAADPDEVQGRLVDAELGRFRGFRLLVAGAEARSVTTHAWDGRVLVSETAEPPLVSSSLDGERARLERAALYSRASRAGAPLGALERFHRSHAPARGPWSPCMHREDAVTVSLSHVHVDAARVAFRYAAGRPCRTPFGENRVLTRRSAPAR